MQKIRKTRKTARRRRKLNLFNFSMVLLVAAGLAYLCSSLFLRSYNNELSTRIQQRNSETAVLQTQNDAVAVDIQTLEKKERVDQIASSDGMTSDSNSVITISASTDQATSGD